MRVKELLKIERKNDEYLLEQIKLIYASTAIALKRNWHWEKNGIVKLMDMTHEVWKECAATNERSMIQMLDEETGVELQNGDGKSWKDLAYLNNRINMGHMTPPQWIYMRNQQRKWIPAQVTACILLALKRKCGFDEDQIAEAYQKLLEVEQENLFSYELAMEQCQRETKVNLVECLEREKP